MDGVYHATFVSARMHFAMQELLASGLLRGEETALAQEAAARDRGHFFVVSGCSSPLGAKIRLQGSRGTHVANIEKSAAPVMHKCSVGLISTGVSWWRANVRCGAGLDTVRGQMNV